MVGSRRGEEGEAEGRERERERGERGEGKDGRRRRTSWKSDTEGDGEEGGVGGRVMHFQKKSHECGVWNFSK